MFVCFGLGFTFDLFVLIAAFALFVCCSFRLFVLFPVVCLDVFVWCLFPCVLFVRVLICCLSCFG